MQLVRDGASSANHSAIEFIEKVQVNWIRILGGEDLYLDPGRSLQRQDPGLVDNTYRFSIFAGSCAFDSVRGQLIKPLTIVGGKLTQVPESERIGNVDHFRLLGIGDSQAATDQYQPQCFQVLIRTDTELLNKRVFKCSLAHTCRSTNVANFNFLTNVLLDEIFGLLQS